MNLMNRCPHGFSAKGRLEDRRLYRPLTGLILLFSIACRKRRQYNTITLSGNSQLTILEIKRDMATLSLAELNLTMELLNQSCGEIIVRKDRLR